MKHATNQETLETLEPPELNNHSYARANKPAERPTDYAWETLVEETRAVPEIERGSLNAALKAIRASCAREGICDDEIPGEIRRRARLYRTGKMADCCLTPMALAKNWLRVLEQPSARLSPERQALQRIREQAQREAVL